MRNSVNLLLGAAICLGGEERERECLELSIYMYLERRERFVRIINSIISHIGLKPGYSEGRGLEACSPRKFTFGGPFSCFWPVAFDKSVCIKTELWLQN